MRRFKTVSALLVALVLLASCSNSGPDVAAPSGVSDDPTPFQGVPLAEGTPKPDFTLIDTDGNEFDFLEETAGSTTFLFFGYSHCPDICPPHLAQIAQVLDMPSSPTNVKVVFVTVDPDRDTPEVLRTFLDKFDKDFIGLTGDAETIYQAQIDTGVPPAQIGEPDEDGDYLIGHSGEMRAYAPNGIGYVTFPYGARQAQFSHDLQILDRLRSPDDTP